MLDVYDNASGVSELMARHTILGELRADWRSVAEGQLPHRPSSASFQCSGCPMRVAHTGSKKVHFVLPTARVTMCRMWACGSPDCPTERAQFADIPTSWARCGTCGA